MTTPSPLSDEDLDKAESLLKAALADSGYARGSSWSSYWGARLIAEVRASRSRADAGDEELPKWADVRRLFVTWAEKWVLAETYEPAQVVADCAATEMLKLLDSARMGRGGDWRPIEEAAQRAHALLADLCRPAASGQSVLSGYAQCLEVELLLRLTLSRALGQEGGES